MSREKILLVGASGAGKTHAHLTIAREYPNSDFYVLDTDDSLERSLEDPQFADVANVHSTTVHKWEELIAGTEQYLTEAGPDDWLIIDRMDMPWEWVRGYYIGEIYDMEPDEYMLMRRDNMDGDRPMQVGEFGMGDWTTIKRIYESWHRKLIYRSEAHLLATARPKDISEYASAEVQAMFSSIGVMPAGEKRCSHDFHTILYLQRFRSGTHGVNGDERPGHWEVTTAKDRGRLPLDGEELTDFARQYIRRIAEVEKT